MDNQEAVGPDVDPPDLIDTTMFTEDADFGEGSPPPRFSDSPAGGFYSFPTRGHEPGRGHPVVQEAPRRLPENSYPEDWYRTHVMEGRRSDGPEYASEEARGGSLYHTPPAYQDVRRTPHSEVYSDVGDHSHVSSSYHVSPSYVHSRKHGFSAHEIPGHGTSSSFRTPPMYPEPVYDSLHGYGMPGSRLYFTPYQSLGDIRHSTPMDHLPGIARPSYVGSPIGAPRTVHFPDAGPASVPGSPRPGDAGHPPLVPSPGTPMNPPGYGQVRESSFRVPREGGHPSSVPPPGVGPDGFGLSREPRSSNEGSRSHVSDSWYPSMTSREVSGNPPAPDPAAVERRSPSKLFKPEKYDGTGDWGDYIDHFEQVSTWNGWSLTEKAAQLSMNLTGVARQAWCDGRGSRALSYETLLSVLQQRFRPEGQEEAYKAEFRSKVHGKDETYLEYGHKMRRLAIRAFPGMGHDSREDLVRDQFIQSLEGEMRRHVSLAHPKSLDQAVTMATEYETVSRSLRPVVPQKPKVLGQVTEEKSEGSPHTMMTDILKEIRRTGSTQGAPGEEAKSLASELLDGIKQLVAARPGGSKARPRGPPPSLDQIQCFHCKEMGHYRNDCEKYRKFQADRKKNPLNG